MSAPEPVRYSAPPSPAGELTRLEYAPGGRWERILAELDRTNRSRSDLAALVASGRHRRRDERRKVWNALTAMTEIGFVRQVGPSLFAITERGRAALQDGDAV